MIPPRAGEITVSQSNWRSLSASQPQTFAAIVGVLKEQRALEILAAVQTRAQNEVAVQQRAGFAEKCQQIFAHLCCRAFL